MQNSINAPICNFELNREKAKQLSYFMQFGRNYKIMLQSDAQYRSEAEALKFTYVRNREGGMVPLETLLHSKYETSPANITRFNGSRNISIQGSNAEGFSSGQVIAAMEEVVHEVVPKGFSIEWSGQSREEKKSAGSTMQVLALALIFVFFCLAALYES